MRPQRHVGIPVAAAPLPHPFDELDGREESATTIGELVSCAKNLGARRHGSIVTRIWFDRQRDRYRVPSAALLDGSRLRGRRVNGLQLQPAIGRLEEHDLVRPRLTGIPSEPAPQQLRQYVDVTPAKSCDVQGDFDGITRVLLTVVQEGRFARGRLRVRAVLGSCRFPLNEPD